MPRLHFATQLYRPARDAALPGLLAALESNLRLPFITRATIFLDGCEPPWPHPAVRWRRLDRRASYADFLELMHPDPDVPAQPATPTDPTELQQAPTHLLFANSDIVFDDDIGRAAAALASPDWAICLTRRERGGSYPAGIEPLQSQDGWLLPQRPPDPLLLDQLRAIRLGVAGCEHLFAAALVAHGFSLWNPSEDCRAIHTDPDPVAYAPHGSRYWGLYAYVPPCRLEDVGRTDPELFFAYARAPGQYFGVRFHGAQAGGGG